MKKILLIVSNMLFINQLCLGQSVTIVPTDPASPTKGTLDYYGFTNQLQYWNNSTWIPITNAASATGWGLSGTNIYSGNTGNVGIGLPSPSEKLHVVGNKAYFQTNFFGIGTNTPTTVFTGFALKNNVNSFYGIYVDAGASGQPFYGYALNGVATAYHQFNGTNQQYEYYHTNIRKLRN
jgi:hypothetical protein